MIVINEITVVLVITISNDLITELLVKSLYTIPDDTFLVLVLMRAVALNWYHIIFQQSVH